MGGGVEGNGQGGGAVGGIEKEGMEQGRLADEASR